MSAPHVTVRMYKGLLGDCFLLRLFKADRPDRSARADAHILIDCGIIQRAPEESRRMARVVADLLAIAKIDLAVVTHEHYDHICGFEPLLKQGIKIQALWMAWTEDLEDQMAQDLRKVQDDTRMAVAAGIQHMGTRAHNRPWALAGEAKGLDNFIGPLAAGASSGMTSRDILEGLKARAESTEYRTPGEVISLGFVDDIRAFVLGPPQNMTRLMKDRPSSSPKNRETYLARRADDAKLVIRSFAGAPEASGVPNMTGRPFAEPYCKVKDDDLRAATTAAPSPNLPRARNAWAIWQRYRSSPKDIRIDDDWQNPVGNLALKLDSDTNNTSLVLAFELGGAGGDVLLFVADAQVGNWLSWEDQKYPKDGPSEQQIEVGDLLKRTVLYKVGHHGSHNATLRKVGLEKIKGENLVAMLPVVKEVAEKRGWNMPYGKMFSRLEELTAGRILSGDEPLGAELVANIRNCGKDVREADDDGSGLGPLWVEYDVS